jgi:aryl-alcohol dehydrogenase-like predicted oxidoreductase
MSELGLGTAAIGRPIYMNIRESKFDQSNFDLQRFAIKNKHFLQFAYDAGIRHFDTAPNYGLAEKSLIEWIKKNEICDLKTSSKWGYTYVANFDPNAQKHEEKEHSLAKLNEQWEQTKKLIPSLSTYQIHSATLASGVLENGTILSRLVEIKKKENIKIGLTVTGDNQNEIIDKALSIKFDNEDLFDSIQATFNVFDQSLLKRKKVLKSKQIIIKEALANGRVFPNNNYPNYKKHYSYLQGLALKYKVGIDAIALRFCMQSIFESIVLCGASTTQQLTENLRAYTFTLSDSEMEELYDLAIEPTLYWAERKKLGWN